MYVRAGRARLGRDAQGEYLQFDQEHQRNQLVSVCAALEDVRKYWTPAPRSWEHIPGLLTRIPSCCLT